MASDNVATAPSKTRDAIVEVVPEQSPEDPRRKAIYTWWRNLHGHDRVNESGPAKRSANRSGDRAELVRCRTPGAVAMTPAFSRLRRTLPHRGEWNRSDEMLAVLVGVLAHVRSDDTESRFANKPSFAARLASGDGKPRMSGLRFRRLLKAKTAEEAMRHLIDAVRLCDGTASVTSLARDLPWLLHPNERTKKDWALAYYSTVPPDEL